MSRTELMVLLRIEFLPTYIPLTVEECAAFNRLKRDKYIRRVIGGEHWLTSRGFLITNKVMEALSNHSISSPVTVVD